MKELKNTIGQYKTVSRSTICEISKSSPSTVQFEQYSSRISLILGYYHHTTRNLAVFCKKNGQ